MDTKIKKENAQTQLEELLKMCDIVGTIENRFLTKQQITQITEYIKTIECKLYLLQTDKRRSDNLHAMIKTVTENTVKELKKEGMLQDAR